jgi:hypothetical protein
LTIFLANWCILSFDGCMNDRARPRRLIFIKRIPPCLSLT